MSRHSMSVPNSRGTDGHDFAPLGLVIKARLGDDIRRIPILNEDLTYDELMLMMQRVFRGKLAGTDDIVIKYTDEDGDLVSIVDGSDLSFAIQCCRGVLNLTLLVNGKPLPIEASEVRHVRLELQSLRKQVDGLLDHLAAISVTPVTANNTDQAVASRNQRELHTTASSENVRASSTIPVVQPTAVLSPTSGREFDPLSAGQLPHQQQQQQLQQQHKPPVDDNVQQKVLSSFGLAAASTPADASLRSGTPDSIGSVNSAHSASRQPQSYQPQPQQYGLQQQQQQPQHHQQQQQPMYAEQPVPTGYSQPQQPVQTTYNQPSAGYNQPVSARAGYQNPPMPGYGQMAGVAYAGHPVQLPPDQQQQQQMQANVNVMQQQQQQYSAGAPQMSGTGGGVAGNPYARGPQYGGPYPRPQGQFPQSS